MIGELPVKKRVIFSILFSICAMCSFADDGNLYIPGDGLPGFDDGGKIRLGDIPFDTWVHNIAAPHEGNKKIAMFVIPLNYTVQGEWEQFELKASTNNFSHAVSEDVRLQYYAQSEIADTGANRGEGGYNTNFDKMWIFVCTGHSDGDNRSYFYIGNTMPNVGWTHHMTTVVVLVDVSCLKRHSDGEWLKEDNIDLMWVWHRYYYSGGTTHREVEDGSSLWRPISPVRWFDKLPNWASEQIPALRW